MAYTIISGATALFEPWLPAAHPVVYTSLSKIVLSGLFLLVRKL
jgi:hypothetical protein